MWHRSISLMIVLALLCLAGCATEDDAGTAATTTPTTEPTTTTTEAATTTEAVDPTPKATVPSTTSVEARWTIDQIDGEWWPGADVAARPGGGFVVATDGMGVFWTEDGEVWTDADPERMVRAHFQFSDYSEGYEAFEQPQRLAVVGDRIAVLDRDAARIWIGGLDGGAWEPIPIGDGPGASGKMAITSNDDVVFVIAEDGTYSSVDPEDGTVRTGVVPQGAQQGSFPMGLTAAWFEDRWVVARGPGESLVSEDLVEWEQGTLLEQPDDPMGITSLVAGDGTIIATGCRGWGPHPVVFSDDGIEWQWAPVLDGHAGAAYSEALGFVTLVGDDTDVLATSPDGRAWAVADVDLPGPYGEVVNIAASGNQVLLTVINWSGGPTGYALLLTLDPLAVATELADAWVAAWDAMDPEAVADVFTEDGVYVHTDQRTHEGRESIELNALEGPQPIDPERLTDVTLGDDGEYVFRVKFGWAGNTHVEDVHLELDGDHASYIGWADVPETYRGMYDHLFEADYAGMMEVTSGDFCEEGWVPMEGTVTGTEAELGPFEATARHCSNPETGRIAEGSTVIVMADGDELYASYQGRMVGEEEDGSLKMHMVQTYDGGTGRFAGAEGLADEPCTARYVSDTQAEVSGSLKGTLTYHDAES